MYKTLRNYGIEIGEGGQRRRMQWNK